MIEYEREVWSAYTNNDLNEGRGGQVLIAHFVNREDAIRAGKGRGVQGMDLKEPYDIRKETLRVRVYESFKEFEDVLTADARKRGLSKLTFEEQKALGLTK